MVIQINNLVSLSGAFRDEHRIDRLRKTHRQNDKFYLRSNSTNIPHLPNIKISILKPFKLNIIFPYSQKIHSIKYFIIKHLLC